MRDDRHVAWDGERPQDGLVFEQVRDPKTFAAMRVQELEVFGRSPLALPEQRARVFVAAAVVRDVHFPPSWMGHKVYGKETVMPAWPSIIGAVIIAAVAVLFYEVFFN